MNIISQKFKKLSTNLIFSLKNKEIKSILGRQRLKFNRQQIIEYVQIIFEHTIKQITFKKLHQQSLNKVKYSCFMSNISLFAKLFQYLFTNINKKIGILPSKLLNIVDTTLIEEKKVNFITQDDWDSGRVTTRTNKKNKQKIYTCGSKGLLFVNRFSKIYHARLLDINFSDQNILKDFSHYLSQLKGILLADRGFNNKCVRERLNNIGNKNLLFNIFNHNQTTCRLISPPHYKEKVNLTEKERKLYKRRWKIETVFQQLKQNYSNYKLNLKGKYTKILKTAKFYTALIIYNLSPQ